MPSKSCGRWEVVGMKSFPWIWLKMEWMVWRAVRTPPVVRSKVLQSWNSAKPTDIETTGFRWCLCLWSCSYLQGQNKDGEAVQGFVSSKTRVAPLKKMLLSCLELMKASVGAKQRNDLLICWTWEKVNSKCGQIPWMLCTGYSARLRCGNHLLQTEWLKYKILLFLNFGHSAVRKQSQQIKMMRKDIGRRWKYHVKLLELLAKGWPHEPKSVHKCQLAKPTSLKVGKVVLFGDNNVSRQTWKIGRGTELEEMNWHIHVLSASSGSLLRQVVQLIYPLEIV